MYGHSEPLWRGHVQRILLHFLNKSRFIFTCDFYLLNPSDYTTKKKKLICFSVGKWQVGAAVYWNMHTYMCQYCGIGLRPLLKDKIGHVFFQFFPPSCPNSLLHFPDGIASFLTRSSTPLTKMQHKPHQSFRHVLQMAVVTVARFSWPLLYIFRIWSIQYNFI